MRSYQDTLSYLFSRLPVFQNIGKAAYIKDLTNTRLLCDALGNPENGLICIHIAGTNGKGSVSNYLAAIFQAHGYKTGLYTSPHLRDFRERIRINGKMIPKKEVIQWVNRHRKLIEQINPSFFEATVALTFDYFRREKTDIAIIETGLGGRLDSTNVVTPELSVITNIGFDHMDILGDTLEKIAAEKAGIIKHGIPVVIGEHQQATDTVFNAKAKREESSIFYAEDLIKEAEIPDDTDLKGEYQRKNMRTVLAALKVLTRKGYTFDRKKTEYAMGHVQELTGFRGRWDILKTANPRIVADTGHNEHGIRNVVKQLLSEKYRQLHMVIGMVEDKDHDKVLELLPKDAVYYFCRPSVLRGFDADKLKEKAARHSLKGESYPSVADALKSARKHCGKQDLIFIGGSTFVVAEVV